MTKDTLKRYLISSGVTFAAMFLMTFCATIIDPEFTFSKAAISGAVIGAVSTAGRSLAKVVYEFAAKLFSENNSEESE